MIDFVIGIVIGAAAMIGLAEWIGRCDPFDDAADKVCKKHGQRLCQRAAMIVYLDSSLEAERSLLASARQRADALEKKMANARECLKAAAQL